MVKKPLTGKESMDRTIRISMWVAQCVECFKWRVIPTQEQYEEIRSKAIENPFVCCKMESSSCQDPTDIEYDNSRIWVMDRHNLPKSPPGFKRSIVIRKDYSQLDCYYKPPKGKFIRSRFEVEKFLAANKECCKGLSSSDFSFVRPKLMEDTIPEKCDRINVVPFRKDLNLMQGPQKMQKKLEFCEIKITYDVKEAQTELMLHV